MHTREVSLRVHTELQSHESKHPEMKTFQSKGYLRSFLSVTVCVGIPVFLIPFLFFCCGFSAVLSSKSLWVVEVYCRFLFSLLPELKVVQCEKE